MSEKPILSPPLESALGNLRREIAVMQGRLDESDDTCNERLAQLVALRNAARRVVACWGNPKDPLIAPEMGEAIEDLKRAIEATKPPFPGKQG